MSTRTNTAKWVPSANRWQIKVQKNGIRKTFTSSIKGRAGQMAANNLADAWLDEVTSLSAAEKLSCRVDALYQDFLKSKKESTGSGYCADLESRYRNHIYSVIGYKKISDLNEQDLQNVINRAYSHSHLSQKSLKNLRGDLSSFLKYCRMIHASMLTAEFITIPAGAKRPEKHILQPESIAILFSCDTVSFQRREVFDDLINAYRLSVLTGLRPGELHGLQWADVLPDRINIKRSINVRGEVTQGKNANACRTVLLSDLSARCLAEQRQYTGKDLYVFPIHDLKYYRWRWQKYCEYHNIPYVSPYELRHTFVSIAQELPEAQVKQMVGHSQNMDTFGVYGHVVSGQREKAANQINLIFHHILKQA